MATSKQFVIDEKEFNEILFYGMEATIIKLANEKLLSEEEAAKFLNIHTIQRVDNTPAWKRIIKYFGFNLDDNHYQVLVFKSDENE